MTTWRCSNDGDNKNMVTEMPEPETYEKLFETVETPPTFLSKTNESIKDELDTEKEIQTIKKILMTNSQKN